MKALEFSATIANNSIELPDNVQLKLKNENKKVRVILLLSEELEEDETWKELTAKQFLEGYGEDDSIYDNY